MVTIYSEILKTLIPERKDLKNLKIFIENNELKLTDHYDGEIKNYDDIFNISKIFRANHLLPSKGKEFIIDVYDSGKEQVTSINLGFIKGIDGEKTKKSLLNALQCIERVSGIIFANDEIVNSLSSTVSENTSDISDEERSNSIDSPRF